MKRSISYGLALASSAAVLSLIWATFAAAADAPSRPPRDPATASSNWAGSYVGGYVGAQQGKSNTGVDAFTDTQNYTIPGQTIPGQVNPVQKCYTQHEWEGDGPAPVICHDSKYQFLTTQPFTTQPTNLTTSQSFPGASSNGNVIGVTGGLYGGYNWVQGKAILGIEADGGWSGARDYVQVYAVNASHRMPWNFNLTARAGFLVMQNTLLYGKGGLAVLNQHSEITGPTGTASENKTKAGWTIGGGIEQANFILGARGRVELMYAKVSDQTVSIPGASTTLNGGSWKGVVGLAWSLN